MEAYLPILSSVVVCCCVATYCWLSCWWLFVYSFACNKNMCTYTSLAWSSTWGMLDQTSSLIKHRLAMLCFNIRSSTLSSTLRRVRHNENILTHAQTKQGNACWPDRCLAVAPLILCDLQTSLPTQKKPFLCVMATNTNNVVYYSNLRRFRR